MMGTTTQRLTSDQVDALDRVTEAREHAGYCRRELAAAQADLGDAVADAVHRSDLPIVQVADVAGIARNTAYTWLRDRGVR